MNEELWKRQPWDTQASYNAFTEYYLIQEPPRSVDQAYRLLKGYGQDTSKRAPMSWRFWSRGQDPKGNAIPEAVSWEKRASAWDDHQKQLAFEQETKDRLAKRKQRRAMLDKAFYNITAMLQKFDPAQFNPKALETEEFIKAAAQLTNAARIISDQLRAEYDDTPAQNINVHGQMTTKQAPVVKVYLPDNGRSDRNS